MANKIKYTVFDLETALKDINDKLLSINKVAIKYGVSKSTLSMKLSGKSPVNRKMGPNSFLNIEQKFLLNADAVDYSKCIYY